MQPVHVPPPQAEFHAAIDAEIEAVRRATDRNALSLKNGKRVAQVGTQFQYRFAIESTLQTPPDVPGTLYAPQREPVEGTVLSVEGLSVLLSVSDDVGEFVPNARLVTDLSYLLVKLIERLEDHGSTPNPTGDRVLGFTPITGKPYYGGLRDAFDSSEQESAVRSALGRDITYIWGPPVESPYVV